MSVFFLEKKKKPRNMLLFDAWIAWQGSSLGTIHRACYSPSPCSELWKRHSGRWNQCIVSQLDQYPTFSLLEDTPNVFHSLKQGLSTGAPLKWPAPFNSTALRTKCYVYPKGVQEGRREWRKERWKKRRERWNHGRVGTDMAEEDKDRVKRLPGKHGG